MLLRSLWALEETDYGCWVGLDFLCGKRNTKGNSRCCNNGLSLGSVKVWCIGSQSGCAFRWACLALDRCAVARCKIFSWIVRDMPVCGAQQLVIARFNIRLELGHLLTIHRTYSYNISICGCIGILRGGKT